MSRVKKHTLSCGMQSSGKLCRTYQRQTLNECHLLEYGVIHILLTLTHRAHLYAFINVVIPLHAYVLNEQTLVSIVDAFTYFYAVNVFMLYMIAVVENR